MTIDPHLDRDLRVRMVDAQLRQSDRQLERGVVGRLFGYGNEKPSNIAAFVMVLAFIGILVLAFVPASVDFPRREAVMGLIGVISGGLGYVFGHGSRQDQSSR